MMFVGSVPGFGFGRQVHMVGNIFSVTLLRSLVSGTILTAYFIHRYSMTAVLLPTSTIYHDMLNSWSLHPKVLSF